MPIKVFQFCTIAVTACDGATIHIRSIEGRKPYFVYLHLFHTKDT